MQAEELVPGRTYLPKTIGSPRTIDSINGEYCNFTFAGGRSTVPTQAFANWASREAEPQHAARSRGN